MKKHKPGAREQNVSRKPPEFSSKNKSYAMAVARQVLADGFFDAKLSNGDSLPWNVISYSVTLAENTSIEQFADFLLSQMEKGETSRPSAMHKAAERGLVIISEKSRTVTTGGFSGKQPWAPLLEL